MSTKLLLSLPNAQIDALKRIAAQKNKPRTEIIREAIQAYITQHEFASTQQDVFGLWRERQTDGLDYQERLRSEW